MLAEGPADLRANRLTASSIARRMGRFTSAHDPLVLLAIMREVRVAADPDAPDQVSQRAYDAARVTLGHGDPPRADKLAARFGVSWPQLRERVLHADDPARAVALRGKRQDRRVLTRAEAVAAVRRVAAIERVERMEPEASEVARRAINAAPPGATATGRISCRCRVRASSPSAPTGRASRARPG